MMNDQETNHQGNKTAHGHLYNMFTRFKALVLVSPHHPESTFPPRWKSCSHSGETCSSAWPGRTWLATGVTELRSFEGVVCVWA